MKNGITATLGGNPRNDIIIAISIIVILIMFIIYFGIRAYLRDYKHSWYYKFHAWWWRIAIALCIFRLIDGIYHLNFWYR